MTPEERIAEVLNRRKMLKGMSVAGATCLLPVPDIVASAQLLDGRRRIGAGELAFAEQTATELAIAYLANPDADVVRATQAHAYTLLDLLRLGPGKMSLDSRARLAAIASDAAALAGESRLWAGRVAEAGPWFATALELARQAGDRRLEAHALAVHAWIPSCLPEPDHAAVAAAFEEAAELAEFLPPAGRASVYGNLAWERAALGDDLASGRFLEVAQTAAAQVPLAEPGWGWWSLHGGLAGWEGSARPAVFAGGRLVELGRPAEALPLFDSALSAVTAPMRRSFLYTHLMTACVGLDDPDRACALGIAGLDEAGSYEFGVFVGEVRRVRQRFPRRWATLRPVLELDERLALAG